MENKKIKMHGSLRIYLISRWFYLHNLEFLAKLFFRLNNIIYQCSIAYESELDPTVRICHARGIMINKGVTIGEHTVLYQQVTIGDKLVDTLVNIKIGKNCLIGVNSCVLGIVNIGDNVKIGANTVVTKDVPSNSTVVGCSSRIIKNKINEQ